MTEFPYEIDIIVLNIANSNLLMFHIPFTNPRLNVMTELVFIFVASVAMVEGASILDCLGYVHVSEMLITD